MKLSVIIPVFNAENYLDGTIRSILNQSFQDFELILVNDGSTDNSLQICKQYQVLDTRIKVLDKSNGGVSTARNRGLKEATGEWIYFVDADDTICDGLFNVLETEQNCDIIQFGYHTIQPNGTIITKYPNSNTVYTTADEFIEKSTFKTLTLWIHFIKLDIINNNNIRFSKGIKYAEDLEFVIKCYAYASGIKTEAIIGYNYYIRESSAMSKAYIFEHIKVHLDVANNLINFYTQNNLKKSIFFKSRIEYMVKSYFSLSLKSNNFQFKELISYYNSYHNIKKIKKSLNHILLKYFPQVYLQILMIFYKR